MKIELKLFAMLSDYLPPEARRSNRIDLELDPGTTPAQVIERLSLPLKQCHLVLINGVFVPPEARAVRALIDGDALAIWPPIAGG